MLYSSSFVIVKHFASKVEPLLTDVGTELLLTGLFCLGFSLFRVSSIRFFFERTRAFKKEAGCCKSTSKKSGGPQQLRAEHIHAYIAVLLRVLVEPLRCHGGKSAEKSKPKTQVLQKSRLVSEPTGKLGHAIAQRIRAALQAGDADQAEKAIGALVTSGQSPVPGCMVAFLRLVRKGGGAQSDDAVARTLQRLPVAALPAVVLAAVCDDAARVGDIVALRAIFIRASLLGIVQAPVACEALLRGLAAAGDATAEEAFDVLVEQSGAVLSEQALASVASACTEVRQMPLAWKCANRARETQGKLTLTMYAALLKANVSAKQFAQACDLYADMSANSITPDTAAYGCVIRAAVECGRFGLARELFKESGNPDLLNCMSLIRAAGREKDVPKALRLLEALEKSSPLVDPAAYNCALEACAACADRRNGERLLQRVERLGLADVVSYNTYAKLLPGTRQDAEALLGAMRERGIAPNVVTYNTLARAAAARQDLATSWILVSEMERYHVVPDSFTCSILLKGMKQTMPNVADVDRVLDLVRRACIEPDEVLLNCLLDACVKLRDSSRLALILDSLKLSSADLSPRNAIMVLRACGHARRMDRAWALWHDLTLGNRTEHLAEEAFVSMLEACLVANDLPGAAAVWRQATPRCAVFHRSPMLFATTVKTLVQVRELSLALGLYGHVKDIFACTRVTYNTLIDALVRQDDMAKASELFREMAQNGVAPDLITFSTLVRGHCSRGDLDRALQLLGQMQRQRILPDAALFNSILDGCAHKQMRTLTERVLADMDRAGVAPSNSTIAILVKLYGRCGDLDAAFRVVSEYPRRFGFEANLQVYTCLMAACLSNSDLARALKVYDQLRARGPVSDAKVFRTLLAGSVRVGDVFAAERVLRHALQSPLPPAALDSECVEGVLRLAALQGKMEPLLSELRAAGLVVSDAVVAAVQRG